MWNALLVEAWGTFVLCFVIFALTHSRSHVTASGGVTVPVLIGATVGLLLTLCVRARLRACRSIEGAAAYAVGLS